MGHGPIYSIGHGSRKEDDFLALLKEYGIMYLIDVRSKPYSRFHHQFNRNRMSEFLPGHGITYVFMGDELGGRPADPACYDTDGRVDYNLLKTKPYYESGILRLKTAHEKGVPVAIMCSERDPCTCHRTHLIGKTLLEYGIELMHINEKGAPVEQSSLPCMRPSSDLFS